MNAKKLISRVSQQGKVAQAARAGYWFKWDCQQEATVLKGSPDSMGMGRRAEALVSAVGVMESKHDVGQMHEPLVG